MVNSVIKLVILFFVTALLVFVGFSGFNSITSANNDSGPKVILGLSKIELSQNKTVGAQVDRVIRDIAWKNSSFDVRIPANRIPNNPSELVPYMEGARVQEMMKWADVKVLPLTPARGKKIGWDQFYNQDMYFAADGQGNFSFQIEGQKPQWETVFKPPNGSSETADLILPDTHGFNMVAEQAYLHRHDIDLVISCMDAPYKAKAALYLAQNGLDIYAPCDRFAPDLMNYKQRFGIQKTILGGAPIRKTENGAVIGDQPVAIRLDEPIVIGYTNKPYPDQYYDTPWRYFTKLNEVYGLNLSLTKVDVATGEAGKIAAKAEEIGASVIGVRVTNEDDYRPIAEWLKEDRTHRAVLLHSVAYSPGARLFQEFPEQTTFGDLDPVIERSPS